MVNFRKSPASAQPPDTSTVAAPGTGTSPPTSSPLRWRGGRYTVAARSARWDGRRPSTDGTTSGPSRWAWKNRSSRGSSGPSTSAAGPTRNQGECARTPGPLTATR
ncbi:hypothetical protein LUX33_06975 [Actinomadura madurae]|nr:hypothetical protein [Actinomadura madurae]MCP9948181.1 hypothetical protein [Actinomadura madurae]